MTIGLLAKPAIYCCFKEIIFFTCKKLMNEGSAIAILFTQRYNSHPLKSRKEGAV